MDVFRGKSQLCSRLVVPLLEFAELFAESTLEGELARHGLCLTVGLVGFKFASVTEHRLLDLCRDYRTDLPEPVAHALDFDDGTPEKLEVGLEVADRHSVRVGIARLVSLRREMED